MSKGLEFSLETDTFEEDILKDLESEDGDTRTIDGDKDIYEKAEKLFSLLKKYFDDSKEELTKCSLYYNHILQTSELFSSCFVSDSFKIESSSVKEVKCKNLKAAEICLKILLIYLECTQTIDVSKSLIQTSISMLYQAYNHCKDSENFYGEFFEEFTDELGSFYKNVQDVQKATLQKLGVLVNSDSFDAENDTEAIILVFQGIGELCGLVTTLDQNIALMFWKFFILIISKYKGILLERIEIGAFLLPLILNIGEIVSQCIDCLKSREQVIQSEIKLCIVNLATLKKIGLIASGHLEQDIIMPLRNLSLQLFSLMILSHSQTGAESKDLPGIKILLKTLKHAIVPFLSDRMFFISIFHSSQKDVSSDSQVPLILLKLMAISYLKCYTEHTQPLKDIDVLVDIFSTLRKNTAGDDLKLACLKIPVSLVQEVDKETAELITVYQHCYICLAEYCKLFFNCSNASQLFDEHLLNIFLSNSGLISLLISDVWMYFLRSGTIDDVYEFSNTLAKILRSKQDSRIEMLFIRIFKLLPGDHKIRLIKENENVCYLLGSKKIVSTLGLSQQKSSPSVTNISQERIVSLIDNINYPIGSDFQKMIQKACSLLELGTYFIDKLASDQMLKVIEFASIVLKSDVFEIHMAVVSFLKAFIGRTLPMNNKEIDSLTSAIAQLLSDVMQCKNYIIRIEAFNLYIRLAQSTPHPEIVKKTVMKCPALVPSIQSYAAKIPPNGFLKKGEKHALYRQQLTQFQLSNTSRQGFSNESKKLLSDLLA